MNLIKKLLLGLLVVGAVVAVYWYLFRSKTAPVVPGAEDPGEGDGVGLVPTGTSPLVPEKLTTQQALHLTALASSFQATQAQAFMAVETEPKGEIDTVATYADLLNKNVDKPTLINVENDEKTNRKDVLYYKTANVQRQQADVEYLTN
jgi:hypothetical protein